VPLLCTGLAVKEADKGWSSILGVRWWVNKYLQLRIKCYKSHMGPWTVAQYL